MRITGIINLMFRRQRSKGEKTAARADKRKQQPASGQRVLFWCSENKTKRHQRVKEKIERNIEKAARVGKSSAPRQRTVQTIKQPVQQNDDKRRQIPAQRQKRQCQHTDGKSH